MLLYGYIWDDVRVLKSKLKIHKIIALYISFLYVIKVCYSCQSCLSEIALSKFYSLL